MWRKPDRTAGWRKRSVWAQNIRTIVACRDRLLTVAVHVLVRILTSKRFEQSLQWSPVHIGVVQPHQHFNYHLDEQ